jgi:hypothetical protein
MGSGICLHASTAAPGGAGRPRRLVRDGSLRKLDRWCGIAVFDGELGRGSSREPFDNGSTHVL